MVDVVKIGERLASYANHFQHETEIPTRKHGIKSIRYVDDYDNKYSSRIKSSFGWLFSKSKLIYLLYCEDLDGPKWLYTIKCRLSMALFSLKRDNHLPDDILGCDIFFWEESAEYYAKVQPSVGDIVARFLKAQPDNPYAIMIAEEIERVDTAYSESLKEA